MSNKIIIMLLISVVLLCGCSASSSTNLIKEQMQALYGENQEIIGDYDKDLAVVCNNGTFVGTMKNDVISFKGIPYAKQPVGNLRWKATEAVEDNDGIYEAYYFGKSSIQTQSDVDRASYYPQGEDCLYLNIWSNSSNTNINKPVMVFIHGGSYGWGGTSDPLYDGQNFIEEYGDVILITISYRTGILGFIDLSSIEGGEEYAESGNLGLLDQIEALKWIKKNIAGFGGDSNNITIFGQSAGGGSVSLLAIMPQAEGLFQRVIAQSGSIALTYSKEESQDLTKRLVSKANIECMNDLLKLTEDEIKELNKSLNRYNIFPERDGVVLPEDLYQLYENGVSSNIDLMIGTNADEARYWIGLVGGLPKYKFLIPILYENNISRISEEDMKYVNEFFELQTDSKVWSLTEFYNEIMFRITATTMATYHSENGGNTYMYYWTYPSSIENYGACHGLELAYVFNNLNETMYTGDNINVELAKVVQEMWVNFAKTGNPSTDQITWKQYNSLDRNTMIISETFYMESDPLSEQRELLENINKYHFNGNYKNLSFAVPSIYKLLAICLVIIIIVVLIVTYLIKRVKKIY